MHTVFGLESLHADWRAATVCIGVFDGVHLGHRELIRTAVSDSRANRRPCVALTFHRHPLAVLRPDAYPKTILPLNYKIDRIQRLGVDVLIVARFDREFASITANRFMDDILISELKAETVVVGHDFAFGKDRGGDVEFLRARIPTRVIPPLEHHGKRVSSTAIRDAIECGDIASANELLGDHFPLSGIVVEGNKMGRGLGIPTINLSLIEDQVIPADAIYAGWCDTPEGRYQAAISIGSRPAIAGAGFAIEAHLLDFPNVEIYGRDVTLWFAQRVREQRAFATTEDLTNQMIEDVEEVRSILGARR